MNSTSQRGIGLMCGTSHDALDMADVSFEMSNDGWSFELHQATSAPLPPALRSSLKRATGLSALEVIQLDRDVAHFTATAVRNWLLETQSPASFIGSHGVTIFHQPGEQLAWQAGNGGIIAALTGLKTISDFRIQDVARGGTGAPLIPVADRALFSDFSYTLNLGGFANITVLGNEAFAGYDICACNLLLNHLAEREGKPFDEEGRLAFRGEVIPEMLVELNGRSFFRMPPPKALGYEWFASEVIPIVQRFDHCQTEDLLATACEHIAHLIGQEIPVGSKVMVTGGGAYNDHLVQLLRQYDVMIHLPGAELIEFREAIAFAFLGLLRLLGQPNTDPRITGAKHPSIAGAVYVP